MDKNINEERINLINIVPTNTLYSYSIMKSNIEELKRTYPFLKTGHIGYSVLGKQIPYIRIGNGARHILYHGSIHANEYITSMLLMKFIESFCTAYKKNTSIQGYLAKSIFSKVSLYIVPMVNPDGVDFVTGNIDMNSNIHINYENIAKGFTKIPFPDGWKANFNGVDLNLQFPAGWKNAKKIKYKQGYTKPAPRDFVGYGPLTEPEAIALHNFTLRHNFKFTISYHTQGKEIYWNFQNINPKSGRKIGERFADLSGYSLEDVPYNSSFAGYKDWFIQKYNKPSYTIEAGIGENPLPISQFDEIYKDNEGILVCGMTML